MDVNQLALPKFMYSAYAAGYALWYNVLNSKASVHQVALGTSVSQAVEKTGRKTESTASTGAPTRGPGELLNSSARRKAAIWHQFPRMSLEDMF